MGVTAIVVVGARVVGEAAGTVVVAVGSFTGGFVAGGRDTGAVEVVVGATEVVVVDTVVDEEVVVLVDALEVVVDLAGATGAAGRVLDSFVPAGAASI